MKLVLLTADSVPDSVLPALSMLAHRIRSAAPEMVALLDAGPYDAVLVDARTDLAVRAVCASCWGPPDWMCRSWS
jgi:hypothetical protein